MPGGFGGSWETLDRRIIIVPWDESIMAQSLHHFAGLGHRVLGAAYYDSDTLDRSRAWLAALRATPGAYGIMYTTWEGKYGLLGAFGDMVAP